MKHRFVAVALVSAGALVSGGCLNFVEPEPGPGQFDAFLQLSETNEPRTEFNARLVPGADEGGDLRSVAASSLRILDTTIDPSPGSDPTQLTYRYSFNLASDVFERSTVELIGPRLQEGAPRARLTAPVVGRAGTDSINLADGEALKLPLRGAQGVRDADPADLRWTLVVREQQGSTQLFSSQSTGSLPDTLVVQQDVLTDGPSRTLEALWTAVIEVQEPAGRAGYARSLRLNIRLRWTITRS